MDPRSETRAPFASERQQLIARLVQEHGRARVGDLARRFDVSAVTIRKDLQALEAEGRLIRAHGGAIAAAGNRPESAFEVRERVQPDAKDRIGRLAAGMVVDGESIAFDASTTALAVARHLRARGGWVHLTVITNGLRIAQELAGIPGITVAMPGGFVRWEALSVVGPLGDGLFRKVNVQRAFLGAAGFSLESGLSDATEEEAQIKRSMADAAREVIGIVDSTKWGRSAFATFCRLSDLSAVIADDGAPAATIAALRGRGIEVHLAAGRDRRAGRRRDQRRSTDDDRGARRARPPARRSSASRSGSTRRRRSTTSRSSCGPARSMGSSARTAPARARSSRSWPASISPTPARCCSTVRRSRCTVRPRPGRWASPSSTRSPDSSRT